MIMIEKRANCHRFFLDAGERTEPDRSPTMCMRKGLMSERVRRGFRGMRSENGLQGGGLLRAMVASAIWFATSPAVSAGFSVDRTDAQLTLKEEGRPVFSFNHGEIQPPNGGVARSGYIHPLYGLDGDVLTDDFPSDHPHHRGVFFGWPRMTVMGEDVDVWHLRGLQPRFHEWEEIRVEDDTASLRVVNLWRPEGSERPAVEERVRYLVRPADEAGRVIDIRGTFSNLTREPVVLRGQTGAGYGGLNVRMDGGRPEVVITTANGALDGDADVEEPASPWAAHTSRAGDHGPRSGVAIFQHPGNPGYPVPSWTLRHYGFLGAAWPGQRSHTIEPGETLELRYRLLVFRGSADEAEVAERFAEFLDGRTEQR